MSLVAVLGIGLLTPAGRGASLAWLALPLAVAGLGVGGFHVFLELSGKLECPTGVFGIGTAPQQSLTMFLLLTSLLIADLVRNPSCVIAIGSSVLVGILLALASTTSNPPMPAPPQQSYAQPPEICRPPYQSP
jgi:hypothetical protein